MRKDKIIGVRIEHDLNRKIKVLSRNKKITSSALCREIIDKYFNDQEYKEKSNFTKTIIIRLLRLELYFRKNSENNADLTDAETAQVNSTAKEILEKIY